MPFLTFRPVCVCGLCRFAGGGLGLKDCCLHSEPILRQFLHQNDEPFPSFFKGFARPIGPKWGGGILLS